MALVYARRFHLPSPFEVSPILENCPVFESGSHFPYGFHFQEGNFGTLLLFTQVPSLNDPYPDVQRLILQSGGNCHSLLCLAKPGR